MKASAVSTITKSLPIEFYSLVDYSLLATLSYINLFDEKNKKLGPKITRRNFSLIVKLHCIICTLTIIHNFRRIKQSKECNSFTNDHYRTIISTSVQLL